MENPPLLDDSAAYCCIATQIDLRQAAPDEPPENGSGESWSLSTGQGVTVVYQFFLSYLRNRHSFSPGALVAYLEVTQP